MSRGFLARAVIVTMGLLATGALAQTAGPAPGAYIAKGGWGNLRVTKDGGFSIGSLGANGHTCDIDGKLKGWSGSAAADDGDPKSICIVTFKKLPNGVRVSPAEGDACRSFCGARASFDGDYLTPPKGCADQQREATRKQFKALYDAKNYAGALAKLQPMAKTCVDQIDWLDSRSIGNDIAVTQFHLGDNAGCLATLRPFTAEAKKSDEDLKGDFPPSDYESVLPLIKATRTNVKMCGG